MKNQTAILACMLFSAFAFSQEDIETSPDEFETPSTVPKGHFQMENRFKYQKEEAGARLLNLPSANWKYGLTDNLEVAVVTTITNYKSPDSTATGLQPIAVGIKVKLWYEEGLLPNASFLAQVKIPKLASRDLQAKYAAPNLKLLFKNTINQNITLGYNIGEEWNGESAEPDFFYSVSPKYQLTKKLQMYIEAYGYVPQHEDAEHWIDAGLMYVIKQAIQIELAAGHELTASDHYHRYYAILGFAFRL
jgi:hypothetical protein